MVNLFAKLQIEWPEELKAWAGSFGCVFGARHLTQTVPDPT